MGWHSHTLSMHQWMVVLALVCPQLVHSSQTKLQIGEELPQRMKVYAEWAELQQIGKELPKRWKVYLECYMNAKCDEVTYGPFPFLTEVDMNVYMQNDCRTAELKHGYLKRWKHGNSEGYGGYLRDIDCENLCTEEIVKIDLTNACHLSRNKIEECENGIGCEKCDQYTYHQTGMRTLKQECVEKKKIIECKNGKIGRCEECDDDTLEEECLQTKCSNGWWVDNCEKCKGNDLDRCEDIQNSWRTCQDPKSYTVCEDTIACGMFKDFFRPDIYENFLSQCNKARDSKLARRQAARQACENPTPSTVCEDTTACGMFQKFESFQKMLSDCNRKAADARQACENPTPSTVCEDTTACGMFQKFESFQEMLSDCNRKAAEARRTETKCKSGDFPSSSPEVCNNKCKEFKLADQCNEAMKCRTGKSSNCYNCLPELKQWCLDSKERIGNRGPSRLEEELKLKRHIAELEEAVSRESARD